MRIITISREFGSGGRELGKRLSDYLGIPCYDHEIIDLIAEKQGLDRDYVARISESDIRTFYPTTIGHRFSIPQAITHPSLEISKTQHSILKELASQGDCIIVGRCADIILSEMNPMKIFVYADTQSKIERCMARATADENLTEKTIIKKMKQIDKGRAAYRELFTHDRWGHRESYHLCINTSGKEIKTLIPGLAEYIKLWFCQE